MADRKFWAKKGVRNAVILLFKDNPNQSDQIENKRTKFDTFWEFDIHIPERSIVDVTGNFEVVTDGTEVQALLEDKIQVFTNFLNDKANEIGFFNAVDAYWYANESGNGANRRIFQDEAQPLNDKFDDLRRIHGQWHDSNPSATVEAFEAQMIITWDSL